VLRPTLRRHILHEDNHQDTKTPRFQTNSAGPTTLSTGESRWLTGFSSFEHKSRPRRGRFVENRSKIRRKRDHAPVLGEDRFDSQEKGSPLQINRRVARGFEHNLDRSPKRLRREWLVWPATEAPGGLRGRFQRDRL
jgi:hypothetical protein